MNHIRTYHYYWHIFFFSLLVCMAEFTKAADRDVLERVIYLAKSKGTVYTLLGKVSEQSGFLFVYDSKVVTFYKVCLKYCLIPSFRIKFYGEQA